MKTYGIVDTWQRKRRYEMKIKLDEKMRQFIIHTLLAFSSN